MMFTIKPAAAYRWDALALGEVILRLDPGFSHIRTARQFQDSPDKQRWRLNHHDAKVQSCYY
jgi:hypothetical protein